MDNQLVYDACCRNYCDSPVALYQYLSNLFLSQFHSTEHAEYILNAPQGHIDFNIMNINQLVRYMSSDTQWHIALKPYHNFGSMKYRPEFLEKAQTVTVPRPAHIGIVPIIGVI